MNLQWRFAPGSDGPLGCQDFPAEDLPYQKPMWQPGLPCSLTQPTVGHLYLLCSSLPECLLLLGGADHLLARDDTFALMLGPELRRRPTADYLRQPVFFFSIISFTGDNGLS